MSLPSYKKLLLSLTLKMLNTNSELVNILLFNLHIFQIKIKAAFEHFVNFGLVKASNTTNINENAHNRTNDESI